MVIVVVSLIFVPKIVPITTTAPLDVAVSSPLELSIVAVPILLI